MAESLDELIFEKEWRRLSPDWDSSSTEELAQAFELFCSKYWHIRHPKRGRIKFDLTKAQKQVIRVWIGERFSIALKARQVGFSTLGGAFAFWLCFCYDDRQIFMISKGEREAVALLSKSRYGLRFLPDWLKARGPVCHPNTQKIVFSNESVIESRPSTDPARGETGWLVIVDEMGQLPNSEDAYSSIEPAADVGGRIIMLGTANGEGNLFFNLWQGAKGAWGNGTNRYTAIFHSWRAAEHRDDAWFAAKCAELPEWQRAQEYPDNPEEAFLKSGRPMFNMEALRTMPVAEPIAKGYLYADDDRGGRLKFVEDGGNLSIWAWPEDGHGYCIGVDVAEGLEHGDFSSLHVIDVKTRVVVAHWHGHTDPDLLGSEIAKNLGNFYNRALLIVEANNHGMTTCIALQRERYFPLYRRRRLGNRTDGQTEALGWMTTAKSKPKAIDELNMAIREGDLHILSKETIAEMRSFVRDGNSKMHGSPHDDRVMSLAIAHQGLQYVHLTEYQTKKGPPPGSYEAFIRLAEKGSVKPKKEARIGSRSVRAPS